MKLSVSNLALKGWPWPAALERLARTPIKGLEIAPSLFWETPERAPSSARAELRRLIADHGLTVAGLQSLLFGHPDLLIFNHATVTRTATHLKRMIDLCHDLGGDFVAFGSPGNRRRAGLDDQQAAAIAVPFFRELAEHAHGAAIRFCIEPIAAEFGGDFLTCHDEAADLVRRVSHGAFRLLWDSGNAITAGDDLVASFEANREWTGHVHVNDPGLRPPSADRAEHRALAAHLRTTWTTWVSLEFVSDQDIAGDSPAGLAAFLH